jgi:hypothetical protein
MRNTGVNAPQRRRERRATLPHPLRFGSEAASAVKSVQLDRR